MCCSKKNKISINLNTDDLQNARQKSRLTELSNDIITDIDEQFIRKRKWEPPIRFLEDKSDVDQVKDETLQGGHCLKKKIASSNVLDLPAPLTLGDKPLLPSSLELQQLFAMVALVQLHR